MTTALTTYQNKLQAQINSIIEDLTTVHSWDDFARRFLLGDGKSPNTTASYLDSCRQYFDFHGGAHPVETATPEHIEQFYDHLIARGVALNTAALRIAGLRFMYRKLTERLPYFDDPFNIMSELLHAKLRRTTKDESEKDAFTEREYQAVLRMLRSDDGLRAAQDYALFRFGVTSGMRAAELCGLRWENVTKTEDGYRATFTGKGRKVRTIQIEQGAYRAALSAFRARWGRKPTGTEHVFQGLPNGRGGSGISTATLGNRINGIADRAKAAGLIRSNLHVSPHVLRHTCATRLVAAGIAIDAVQRHLGHASISTTAVYLHNTTDLGAVWAKMSGENAA